MADYLAACKTLASKIQQALCVPLSSLQGGLGAISRSRTASGDREPVTAKGRNHTGSGKMGSLP